MILVSAMAACGGGSTEPVVERLEGAPIVVMAADQVAAPAPWDGTGVDLGPLGIAPEEIDGAFRFTTPAGALFRFEVLTAGGATPAIAHAAGGATTVELTKARIFYATPGGGTYAWSPDGGAAGPVQSPWFEALPEDIARIEIGGSIEAPQVVVVRAGANYALVFLDLGPTSAIHPPTATSDGAAPLEDVTLASSSKDAFGRPAVAALADAPAVAWLSGNDAAQMDAATYHMRARVEAPPAAGSVPVSGVHHAAAGIGQDLLIARAEGGALTLEHSASSGTAFDPPQTVGGPGIVRHPALAVAPGRFAVAFWRDLDLVLVQGGFPTLFAGAEEILFTAPEGSRPLRPAVAIRGGDLAVAYAFARTELDAGLRALDVSTEFRCFVRAAGDLTVAEIDGIGRGPGVAIADDGSVLCAIDGIRLFERPVGAGFSLREEIGAPGAHSPRVLVRDARLDVCYLQPTARGAEVHRASWADLASAPLVRRVTVASRAWRANGPPAVHAWPVYPPTNEPVPWIGYAGSQVSGFDAASDEAGEFHVAVHEEQVDRHFFILAEPGRDLAFLGDNEFVPPPFYLPPPPGSDLTGALGAANETDRHRLRVLRFPD